MFHIADESFGKDRYNALLQEAENHRLYRRLNSRQLRNLFNYLRFYSDYLKLYGKALVEFMHVRH